jgi:hypothetical protein
MRTYFLYRCGFAFRAGFFPPLWEVRVGAFLSGLDLREKRMGKGCVVCLGGREVLFLSSSSDKKNSPFPRPTALAFLSPSAPWGPFVCVTHRGTKVVTVLPPCLCEVDVILLTSDLTFYSTHSLSVACGQSRGASSTPSPLTKHEVRIGLPGSACIGFIDFRYEAAPFPAFRQHLADLCGSARFHAVI